MVLDENTPERPDIEYPCEWGYKIIGTCPDSLEACVFEIMGERDYTTGKGKTSSKGKFCALTSTCEVASEEDRNALFKAFQDHKDVKMVI
jgi:putative lipoic acid-binding regulatory protein